MTLEPHRRGLEHPAFSRGFDWFASRGPARGSFAPFRAATAGRATGHALELGAGGGYNFRYYDPQRVEDVEATEPDATMAAFARERAAQARIPITVTQASAEALPFPDATFDSVVATLVFCSVADVPRGLREIRRVLKPGGCALLAEHVRSRHGVVAGVQTALVPMTTHLAGNCHWNRDTERAVRRAGFAEVRAWPVAYADWYVRLVMGQLMPIRVIEARNL